MNLVIAVKRFWLAFALLLVLGGLSARVLHAAAAARQQVATTTSIQFSPAQDRYPRGTRITLIGTVRDCYGNGLGGKVVEFRESSSQGQRRLPDGYTDGSGRAYCPYTVPTDPNKDNVCIQARFTGDGTYYSSGSSWRRIPIGL